jgi:hypothetical protein
MDLTPGERAILNQLRQLHMASATRVHPMTAVTCQWPALHYEAYRSSFSGLIGKRLVQPEANGQLVRLTEAGFQVLGLAVPPGAVKAASRSAGGEAPKRPVKSVWRFWR